MELIDLVKRTSRPEPWSEGDNIPWHEPGFSARMLREHLSQEHDAASRRSAKIDEHVNWIRTLLPHAGATVLDLGCGPGLYSSRLARLGHTCVGIDYSPASIAHAQEQAQREGLTCRFTLADIREAEYGGPYDLAMLLYGELNVFRREHALGILIKCHEALAPDGVLLLEPHHAACIERIGGAGTSWYSSCSDVFSDEPHLCLDEAFWDEQTRVAMLRYLVIDATSAEVTRYAQTFQAYTPEEYSALVCEADFEAPTFYPSLTGAEDATQPDLLALVAHRG